jgi:copper ion binding protein
MNLNHGSFIVTIEEEHMAKSTLKIQGMTCNHCVMRVAKALKAVPGVQDAQVDLQKGEAVISYDDAKVTMEKLSFAVVEAGYKVV